MKQISPDYFTFTGEADFNCRSRRLRYDGAQRAMVLQRNDRLRLPETTKAQAAMLLKDHQAALCDANRQLAWISKDKKSLLTSGKLDDASGSPVRANSVEASEKSQELLELQPVTAPNKALFTALAMWDRSIVLAWSDKEAGRHGVDVVDLGSKIHYRLETLAAAPDQVWMDRQARVWVVTQDKQLSLASGKPLPQAWRPDPIAFKPLTDNLHPFALQASYPLPDGPELLALCSDEDYLYLLREGEILRCRLDAPQRGHDKFDLDAKIPYATDCRVLPGGRIALWVPSQLGRIRVAQDCPIVELDEDAGEARLVKERYPRRSLSANAFLVNSQAAPVDTMTRCDQLFPYGPAKRIVALHK